MKSDKSIASGAVTALSLALLLAGCVDRAAQKQAKETEKLVSDPVHVVSIATPTHQTMNQTLEVTGSVTTSDDSSVGPKSGGKIVAVYVKDGDYVHTGQLLALQDTSALASQQAAAAASLAQAQGQVLSAESQLAQAVQNARYGPAKTSAAVAQAKSEIRGAQASLDKLLNGARPEERRQTEATLASAKSNLETQQKELARTKTLVEEGALAGTKLDAQQATYDSAKAAYDTAFEAVRLQQIGNRTEDIDAARETLRQSQEALKTAYASKELDSLLGQQVDAARAAVESAQAQVRNAKALLAVATQAVADAQIKSPFEGRVSGKPVEPGTVVATGATIVRIIGHGGIYFDGQVTAESLPQVAVGNPVDIKIDAFPGREFRGTIVGINPLGSSYGRQFSVRVGFQGDISGVQPGMFARGDVIVKSHPNATVIPMNTIVTKDGRKLVYTLQGGKAHAVPVTTGIQVLDQVEVFGLPDQSKIVSAGQDQLVDGTPVKTESKDAANGPQNG